jgi:hypothetical protein
LEDEEEMQDESEEDEEPDVDRSEMSPQDMDRPSYRQAHAEVGT